MKFISPSEGSKLTIYNHLGDEGMGDLAEEVRSGLTSASKTIPSQLFYDATGSRLFEEICNLPEYYQTRTELSLLKTHGPAIMNNFADGDIIELGSGANWKVIELIEALNGARGSIRYIPVDISLSALIESAEDLLIRYPDLDIIAMVADFNQSLPLFEEERPKLYLFLGSTIGNLDEDESINFLSQIAVGMAPNDRFLIGLDMVKSTDALNLAYNDSKGVTAEFNKNALTVLNREFGGDFDIDDFEHYAFYDEANQRVEMRLKARRQVTATLGALDLTVEIKPGESIRTEICRKFTKQSAEKMFTGGGLIVDKWYIDDKEWFSLAMTKRL